MEGGRRKNIIINTNIKLLEWECDSQGWMLFVCDAVFLSVSQSAGELGPREREQSVVQSQSAGPHWATVGTNTPSPTPALQRARAASTRIFNQQI